MGVTVTRLRRSRDRNNHHTDNMKVRKEIGFHVIFSVMMYLWITRNHLGVDQEAVANIYTPLDSGVHACNWNYIRLACASV
jgi:hypothetical protein